jgi:hypothetical protein
VDVLEEVALRSPEKRPVEEVVRMHLHSREMKYIHTYHWWMPLVFLKPELGTEKLANR